MQTPLAASAMTAGALFSKSTFEVPHYQREYSWLDDEVVDFWTDLKGGLTTGTQYFLGLIILTEAKDKKQVVDGQQRLLTLSLLVAALHHEAIKAGRKALAERIQADFLKSIEYQTDATAPRVTLSDTYDNKTFQVIIDTGSAPTSTEEDAPDDSISERMIEAFKALHRRLRDDLKVDPFKRLGEWTDFITNRLYFAVFIHPDAASAYRIFEVINTRGKELTTADLLKNYVLSQTPEAERAERYKQWQSIARRFSPTESNTFVQYIRHVVTVHGGHILPKDLFDFLANRSTFGDRSPPTVPLLMSRLVDYLPLYMQMVDPSLEGPAEGEALQIFESLNSLSVISVRPILLAMFDLPDALNGLRYILRLVVRRIVVGNLGTGNVERKFGEAAKKVIEAKDWNAARDELEDLNPYSDDFKKQLATRSFNKSTLTFMRRSIVEQTETPKSEGTLHFLRPKETEAWPEFSEEDAYYWTNTLGNSILSSQERRPKNADSWQGVKANLLPTAVNGEFADLLLKKDVWNAQQVEEVGNELAAIACKIWF